MKKIILIFSALFLVNICAYSQWYLFPGLNKESARNSKNVEKNNTTDQNYEANSESEEQDIKESRDGKDDRDGKEGRERRRQRSSFDRPSTVEMTLALPLDSKAQKPNSDYMEMYCGAMLAIRDIANRGLNIKLKFVDTSLRPLNELDVDGSDILIGPVSYEEVKSSLWLSDEHLALVSPLESKTVEFLENYNVIQAPSSWTHQINELCNWLRDDLQPHDEFIVIRDPSASGQGEQSNYLIEQLHNRVMNFRIVKAVNEISFVSSRSYRIIITSDNEAFLANSLRALAIQAERNRDITLYSTSKIRSPLSNNPIDLYSTKTHLTASYHIDYNSQKVKDFILAYRALFKTEPGSFAFHGYDLMLYILNVYSEYGSRWYEMLPNQPGEGLQSDFLFNYSENDGKSNTAVRKVIYNKQDLNTELIQR